MSLRPSFQLLRDFQSHPGCRLKLAPRGARRKGGASKNLPVAGGASLLPGCCCGMNFAARPGQGDREQALQTERGTWLKPRASASASSGVNFSIGAIFSTPLSSGTSGSKGSSRAPALGRLSDLRKRTCSCPHSCLTARAADRHRESRSPANCRRSPRPCHLRD
jgi:hypothetical protein